MQIDRARFLLLTASMAGGGCASAPPVDPPPPPPPPVATAAGNELVVAAAPPDETAPVQIAAPPPTAAPQPPSQPAGACDNDTATVPTCSLKAPGPYCESFAETKIACKTYKTALRGAIAAQAIDCLNKASGTTDICDFSKSESCATAAVRTACVQPSTFNACSGVMSTCGGVSWSKLSMQECQQLLSAVKDGKRQSMISCMTEGCSLESCMWQLQ